MTGYVKTVQRQGNNPRWDLFLDTKREILECRMTLKIVGKFIFTQSFNFHYELNACAI